MRRLLPFALVGFVGVAFLLGHVLRAQAGIEISVDGVRAWVVGLGWTAPAVFVALVTFRHFLFLPSMVVLSAGGLCFGATLGTGLGCLGILVSATMQFSIGRGIGRAWLRPRFGVAMRVLEQRVERAGPLVIALATALPTGPMGPLHWAAGFSTLSATAFLVAVLVSAPIRAFAYAFFGATLLAPGTPRFYAATTILLGIALLPLVHPRLRRHFLGTGDPTGGRSGP